jgi:hypothetical protein
MIEQLQVVLCPSEPGPSRTEVFEYSEFDLVLEQLRLMDRHCRPLLFLCKSAGDHSRDVMEVMGGNGLYFIEATDDRGFWYTPYDAAGGSHRVEIWTSDQGHSVEAKYSWRFDDAQAVVDYYFRRGAMLSAYDWKSVKQM